jgi:hypothetical protein
MMITPEQLAELIGEVDPHACGYVDYGAVASALNAHFADSALQIDPSDNVPCDADYSNVRVTNDPLPVPVPVTPGVAHKIVWTDPALAHKFPLGEIIRNASQLGDDALGENPVSDLANTNVEELLASPFFTAKCAECSQPLSICRCPLP